MSSSRPVILITGAARRVGRALALHFAVSGFDVAFTYHTSEHLAMELHENILTLNVDACAIRANLLDFPAAAQTIASSLASFSPRLDALINNASLYEPDQPTDPTQPQRMHAIHVEAPLQLARLLADPLRQASGCIINMVDILASRPMPGYLAYCASKAGLANLTLALARELAPQVRVNGIAPGVVQWPDDFPEEQRQKYLQRVPLRRCGTPQDVAQLAHFLITAAPYITGQIIAVDGGRSIA